MNNKNVWKYVFYYVKFGSGDRHYFDIYTNQGKAIARELAFKELWDKDWYILAYVSKSKERNDTYV